MSFLRDAAFAAAGYGVSSLVHGKAADKVGEIVNANKDLEDIIMDYAHKHDVWGRDQKFYEKLIKIAENFRDPYAE